MYKWIYTNFKFPVAAVLVHVNLKVKLIHKRKDLFRLHCVLNFIVSGVNSKHQLTYDFTRSARCGLWKIEIVNVNQSRMVCNACFLEMQFVSRARRTVCNLSHACHILREYRIEQRNVDRVEIVADVFFCFSLKCSHVLVTMGRQEKEEMKKERVEPNDD